MYKDIDIKVENILRYQKEGFTLHTDWKDPMWNEFSNFFKYAIGINGRDIIYNEEHRKRFRNYFTTYKRRIENLNSLIGNTIVFLDEDLEFNPIKYMENLIISILNQQASVEDVLQMHLDALSCYCSAKDGKPVLLYMPKDCYGENALKLRLREKVYEKALKKALLAVTCRVENPEDFLFVSDPTRKHILDLLKSGVDRKEINGARGTLFGV